MDGSPRSFILSQTLESHQSPPGPCGFCVVGGIRQNGIELCCNQILILVFLTKKEGLFKLLLRGKWQELVLKVRKSFHPISNTLPMWTEVFLFQETIAEFEEICLVLIITNPSVAGKSRRSIATELHSLAFLGLRFHRTPVLCCLKDGGLTRNWACQWVPWICRERPSCSVAQSYGSSSRLFSSIPNLKSYLTIKGFKQLLQGTLPGVNFSEQSAMWDLSCLSPLSLPLSIYFFPSLPPSFPPFPRFSSIWPSHPHLPITCPWTDINRRASNSSSGVIGDMSQSPLPKISSLPNVMVPKIPRIKLAAANLSSFTSLSPCVPASCKAYSPFWV